MKVVAGFWEMIFSFLFFFWFLFSSSPNRTRESSFRRFNESRSLCLFYWCPLNLSSLLSFFRRCAVTEIEVISGKGNLRHNIVFSVVLFTHVSCQLRLDFLITVRRSETDGNEQARECVLFKKNAEHRRRKAPLALYMPRTLTTHTLPEKTDTGPEKTGPQKKETAT